MNETLRLLYDKFYTPLPMVESEQEVEVCHRQLIERLEKPERKLVLRIMDAQGLIAEQRSVDSFICGFCLAWEMANELNHYEENPDTLSRRAGILLAPLAHLDPLDKEPQESRRQFVNGGVPLGLLNEGVHIGG